MSMELVGIHARAWGSSFVMRSFTCVVEPVRVVLLLLSPAVMDEHADDEDGGFGFFIKLRLGFSWSNWVGLEGVATDLARFTASSMPCWRFNRLSRTFQKFFTLLSVRPGSYNEINGVCFFSHNCKK